MNLTIAIAMLREQSHRTLPILSISLGIGTALCLGNYALLWWEPHSSDTVGFAGATMFAACSSNDGIAQ